MWPTFYLPPWQAYQDFIPGNPFELCGVTAFAASVTVPTPPQATNNSVQVVILDYICSAGGGPVFPTSPATWRRILSNDYVPHPSTIFGSGKQFMFWRVYTTGASDFALSSTLGGIQCAYTSIVLDNPNLLDPWFTFYVHNFSTSGGGYQTRFDGPSTLMEVANSGDLLIFTSASNGGFSATNEPAGADVEFSCTPTFVAPGSGNNGHTISGLQTRAKTVNNLLAYCPTIDPLGWTIVGLTQSAPGISTSCAGYTRLTCNIGSGQHYCEQSVVLTAGKSYLLAVGFVGYDTTNPSPDIWLSYIKPDLTEHGAGCTPVGSPDSMTVSTEIVWGGAGNPDFSNLVGDNTNSLFGGELSFIISPSVTGTYAIRLYVTPRSGAGPPIQPQANSGPGSNNEWYEISGMVLQEGASRNQIPCYLKTGATPILKGSMSGVLTPVPLFTIGIDGSARGWSTLVMRRSGGTRPTCKLFSPYLRYLSMDFTDNDITDTRNRHENNQRGYQCLGTSHVAYEWLSNKKLYLELHVSSFGTGARDAAYSIGFCLAEALMDMGNPISGATWVPGGLAGQYSYNSLGNTYADGSLDAGSVSAWSVGDNIGVGIDFSAFQITYYLNGSLVKTQTITNNDGRYALWRGQFGVRGDATADKQARFTYNFKGSFGGRLPSGFHAFDYDNEIP